MSNDPNESTGTPYIAGAPGPTGSSGSLSFDYRAMYAKWVDVLTHPGAGTFDRLLPGANWQDTLIGVAILGVAQAIFGFIASAEIGRASALGIVTGFIGAFIGFFVGVGILWVSAHVFGGTGTFMPYAYVLSLIIVPLGIISAVAGIVPILGGIIALAAAIYEVVLAVFATAAAHRMSQGTAIAAVLVPAVIVLILFIILSIAAAAFLVSLNLFHP